MNNTAHKMGFASSGMTRKIGALRFYSSTLLIDSLVLLNPHEHKAQKRFIQGTTSQRTFVHIQAPKHRLILQIEKEPNFNKRTIRRWNI